MSDSLLHVRVGDALMMRNDTIRTRVSE